METNVLIEPVIDGKEHGFAVQTKIFSLDLKITNLSKNPSPEFTISSIILTSAEGQDINENFQRKSFAVGTINPEESKIIHIEKNGQFMYGLVYLTVTIVPREINTSINFSQKNAFTKAVYNIGTNRWIDFFYIKNTNEFLQEKTNKWIVRLTWATAIFAAIQILPIIKNIGNYLNVFIIGITS